LRNAGRTVVKLQQTAQTNAYTNELRILKIVLSAKLFQQPINESDVQLNTNYKAIS